MARKIKYMAIISLYLLIILLNVNVLNQSKHIEWLDGQKRDQIICCTQETHLRLKDTHRLKVKEWKGIS